ncbi:MAG: YihY/virulence factor BrkB family protein, partial [Acetatifactor sp.]|nr:YihY/virulence factor BrkB family protein [Acetatifactor sp.]
GNQLVDLALHRFPPLHIFVSFLMNFRFIVVWGILTLFFAAIYTYVPDRKLKFKQQIPGAMFSAIGWSIYSWGFSIYLQYNSYGLYGSLSIVIIALLWMYFCMYIMLFGAYLNHYRNISAEKKC